MKTRLTEFGGREFKTYGGNKVTFIDSVESFKESMEELEREVKEFGEEIKKGEEIRNG